MSDEPDVRIDNCGSVLLFRPLTDVAREWIGEHVQTDAQWLGNGLAVEARYADDLACGMQEDGLVVK